MPDETYKIRKYMHYRKKTSSFVILPKICKKALRYYISPGHANHTFIIIVPDAIKPCTPTEFLTGWTA